MRDYPDSAPGLRGLIRLLSPRGGSSYRRKAARASEPAPDPERPAPGADPHDEGRADAGRGKDERRPFTAHTCAEQITGGKWAELFDSHATLSDVWHAAAHSDPLLWMLRMSDYRDEAALRLFALWAAKEVVCFVPGAERPARMLFMAARAYAAGLSSREAFDIAYQVYCEEMRRAAPERDDWKEFQQGVSAARSAIHSVVVDDPWGAAFDATATAESTFRFDFSGFIEALEGAGMTVDDKLRLSRQACETASGTFGERAAHALRAIVGDPFLLLDERKGRRHLELLRQGIRLRPLITW
ncbi:MAG TPA: hypothetical protein VF736_14405 [Pyrinomonadaceae bacterium]